MPRSSACRDLAQAQPARRSARCSRRSARSRFQLECLGRCVIRRETAAATRKGGRRIGVFRRDQTLIVVPSRDTSRMPLTGKHSGHGDYDVPRCRYRERICPASPLLQACIPPSVRIGVAQSHRDHPGFRFNPSSRALETRKDARGTRGTAAAVGDDDALRTAAPDRGTKGADSAC